MFKKIIFRTLAFLILIVALLFAYPRIMSLFVKDISAPDVSGLKLKESGSIPEDKNIYFFLKKIIEANLNFKDKTYPLRVYVPEGSSDNEKAEVEKILSEYSLLPENFMKVSGLSLFQNPNLPQNLNDSYDIKKNVENLTAFSAIFSFNDFYAKSIASQGKIEEALDILFQTLRVESLILQSGPSALEYLAFQHYKKHTLEILVELAEKADWNPENYKKFNEVLSLTSHEKTKEELLNTLKTEFFVSSSMVNYFINNNLEYEGDSFFTDKFSNTFMKSSYYIHPNKTKKMLAEFYVKKINEIKIDCDGKEKSIDATDYQRPSLFSMYAKSNSMGQSIYHTNSYFISTRLSKVINKSCEIQDLAEKLLVLIKNKQ